MLPYPTLAKGLPFRLDGLQSKFGATVEVLPVLMRLPCLPVTAPEHAVAEVAIGVALRDATEALPPGFVYRPFGLGSVAACALLADAGFSAWALQWS